MYRLNVKNHFSSAHQLRGYEGLCKNIHGHNWKVRACVDCQETDEIGMAIDFGVLKDHLNELMEYLDHQFLNEIEPFDKLNPTSENIARYLFQQLSARLNDQNARVQEIEVWENDNSSAIYFE
jgi:6-pyruvoyltetrahydropterin/6-carboxytetrahydropterin synthase